MFKCHVNLHLSYRREILGIEKSAAKRQSLNGISYRTVGPTHTEIKLRKKVLNFGSILVEINSFVFTWK